MELKEANKLYREATKAFAINGDINVLKEAKKVLDAAKAAVPAKEKVEKIVENGVTRPRDASNAGKIWDIFDRVTVEKGAPAAIAEVMEQALAFSESQDVIRSYHSHWRKFNGVIAGRIAAAVDPEKLEEERIRLEEMLEKAQARVENLKQRLADL